MPLDFIKLHEDLIHDLRNHTDRKRYVGALIAFSHELGVGVVAGGINNEDDAEILKAFNCDLMQGELLVTPMTMQEVKDEFLRDNAEEAFGLRRKA